MTGATDLPPDLRSQPRTAHSQQVLANMLRPAAAIIRQKGILGASVEDLVEAVGVTKGTLYYHIRTKEQLLYLIHDSVTSEGYARWEEVIRNNRDAPPAEVLEQLVETHCVVVMDEYRDCVAVISEEMKYLPPDLQKQIKLKRTEYQALLESVLESGVESGDFAPMPVRRTASLIIGMLNSMYRWYSPDGPLTARAVARQASHLILKGLRPGRPVAIATR
jgi:AcrR family transcriptional regulator